MDDKFVWDVEKDQSNITKHGVSFAEAMTVFSDINALYSYDDEHSNDEERFIVLGISSREQLLIVCHCYRECDAIIRIFSARKANKLETTQYFGRYKVHEG